MVINVEPLNSSVPLLMADEYLLTNIDRYFLAIDSILKQIDNDDELTTEGSDINTIEDRLSFYLCNLEGSNISSKYVDFLSTEFRNLYELKCQYYLPIYIGPLNYELIAWRHCLSKTDAYCIKIIYSLYHWCNYNDSFKNVLYELGIEPHHHDHKIKEINKRYERRCIKFLLSHISKNENIQKLINIACDVFINNPCYESLILDEAYPEEYDLGYSFEGFYDFSLFEKNPDELIDEFSTFNDEACYTSLNNVIIFDLKYMMYQQDYSVSFDYFFEILSTYMTFISFWNDVTKEIKDSVQLKLDL